MKEFSPDEFEQELRKVRPAPVPEPLARKLEAIVPRPQPTRAAAGDLGSGSVWLWLRWLLPVGAAAALFCLMVWPRAGQPVRLAQENHQQLTPTVLLADQVELDQKLVAVFDTIAPLPDGTPVRFRCREWSDAVMVKDSARGVTIENRTPRLEIVPVRFETD